MDQETVWLGIDVGTTSVKISVINDDGTELSSSTENTSAAVKSDVGEKGFEQCPSKILEVVECVVQPMLSTYQSRIKGIGVTGQMHGVVLWRKAEDEQLSESTQNTAEPLKLTSRYDHALHHNTSHLYTWQDQRCSPSFLETLPKPSNTELPLSTGHGCATLFWLARYGNAMLENGGFDCCGTIMDYLVYLLCGLDHPVTSDQLAASLGYFNQDTKQWDSTLADSPEFPSRLMPTVKHAGTKVGVVRPTLSGWPSGVPVLVGMGDVQCAMSAVLEFPDQAAVNIGTSIQLGFLVPSDEISVIRRQSPPSISFFPYFGRHHLALCAGLNGGDAIKHFVECVANWMRELGFNEDACKSSSVFSKLQTLATEYNSQLNQDETALGSCLTVRPTFHGERHDPTLCGEISNISLTNFKSIGRIYQSVCEGVVHHLGTMVSPSYLHDRKINELLICGSVPSKNPFVKNALKDIYGGGNKLLVNAVSNQSSSAVGAARTAKNVLKI